MGLQLPHGRAGRDDGEVKRRPRPSSPKAKSDKPTITRPGGFSPGLSVFSNPGAAGRRTGEITAASAKGPLPLLIPICIQSDTIWRNSPQRHRETTRKTAKTQRSGEQEDFFSYVHLMLFSVPLCLCGELFLGSSSCPSWLASRNVHALDKNLNCISLIAPQYQICLAPRPLRMSTARRTSCARSLGATSTPSFETMMARFSTPTAATAIRPAPGSL